MARRGPQSVLLAWQQCTQQQTLGAALLSQTRGTPASLGISRHFSSQEQAQSQAAGNRTAVYAACVLERLPIIRSPPPRWEAEYKAWVQQRQISEGRIKQYPSLDNKQKGKDSAANAGDSGLWSTQTRADKEQIVSTMKRRLADKLVLLVKATSTPAAAAAGSEQPPNEQPEWTFPFARHASSETIRQTAERALREAIGPAAVYFVGNAPMAHLELFNNSSSSSSSAGAATASSTAAASSADDQASSSSSARSKPEARVFFHLAQVVNDPWDVELAGGTSVEHAWVSKQELRHYIKDARLLALARKML